MKKEKKKKSNWMKGFVLEKRHDELELSQIAARLYMRDKRNRAKTIHTVKV